MERRYGSLLGPGRYQRFRHLGFEYYDYLKGNINQTFQVLDPLNRLATNNRRRERIAVTFSPDRIIDIRLCSDIEPEKRLEKW